MCLGAIIFSIYCGQIASGDEEDIPDKVGVEVHLSKKERATLQKIECSMCKTVVKEMHVEVAKHKMTGGGWGSEEKVWETSNAMCLGILQKYNLLLDKQKLERKTEDEEENGPAGMSSNPELQMRGMLVLKMGCQSWVQDYGGDTSGYIYKSVRDGDKTAEALADDLCLEKFNQCGKHKKEKKKEEKANAKKRGEQRRAMDVAEAKEIKKQEKDDPMASLPEDSKLGLQRMLEMAADDPLHYVEDDARQRILKAQKELPCEVCKVVLEDTYTQVTNRPASMRAEHDILSIVENACSGGKDKSVPSYFGVEPPPLPPAWTDRWRPTLDKKSKRYKLKPFPKKAAKKRKAWRELTPTGRHKPPPNEEGEGDMMMTLSCKAMLASERMSEELFTQMQNCKTRGKDCDAALESAKLACKSEDGKTCVYDEKPPEQNKGSPEKTAATHRRRETDNQEL